jgi:hypothetical protein
MVAALRQQASEGEAEGSEKPKKDRQHGARLFSFGVNSFRLCFNVVQDSSKFHH